MPSILSHNLNSLSLTQAGGITGRFSKTIRLLSFLLNSHTVVCLQDLRLPSGGYINQLSSIFPNYNFFASAKDSMSGGVVTIWPKSMDSDYRVVKTVIDTGYIVHHPLYLQTQTL